MRKIIGFIIFSTLLYSASFVNRDENFGKNLEGKPKIKVNEKQTDCSYPTDPDIYERSLIKLIRKNNLDNKIYCTLEGDKLAYRSGDLGDYMQIGLIYRFKDIDDFGENIIAAIADFEKSRDNLLPNNLSVVDKIGMPRYYNYRMYISFEDKPYTVMMFNHILDNLPAKGQWEYYINEVLMDVEIFQELVNDGDFYITKYTIY